jgi:hypothetical protein
MERTTPKLTEVELELTVGTNITATQTIYVYAETGTTPNCTNEHAFTVTINDHPSWLIPLLM